MKGNVRANSNGKWKRIQKIFDTILGMQIHLFKCMLQIKYKKYFYPHKLKPKEWDRSRILKLLSMVLRLRCYLNCTFSYIIGIISLSKILTTYKSYLKNQRQDVGTICVGNIKFKLLHDHVCLKPLTLWMQLTLVYNLFLMLLSFNAD